MKKFYSFILAAVLAFCGTTQALADDAHPWAGTYILEKVSVGFNYHNETAEAYGFVMKDTFDIVVEWVDTAYVVTRFWGCDLKEMRNGGIILNVENDTYATIPTNQYMINKYAENEAYTYVDEETGESYDIPASTVGLILWGVDGSSGTPITLVKQSDGQVKTRGFGLWLNTGSGVIPVCYYDDCAPLNGGDPEEAYDFAGYYKVNCDWVMNMEDLEWPSEFVMEIQNISGYGCLMQFLGYDVATPNWGAIYVDPDAKLATASVITLMDGFNLIAKINGKSYYLVDYNSEAKSIKMSYDKMSDSVEIDYFNVYNKTDKTESAFYCGCKAVKISKEEADELATSISTFQPIQATTPSAIYNLNGQRITKPAAGTMYIQGGKKYLMK